MFWNSVAKPLSACLLSNDCEKLLTLLAFTIVKILCGILHKLTHGR